MAQPKPKVILIIDEGIVQHVYTDSIMEVIVVDITQSDTDPEPSIAGWYESDLEPTDKLEDAYPEVHEAMNG